MKEVELSKEIQELVDRIYRFVDTYAGVRPDWDAEWDDEDDKFTSPDSSTMIYCARMISNDLNPKQCFSEWSSGGYTPYSSKEGKEEHDYLVKEIYKIINSKNESN